jgi:hypothetical protein
MRCGMNSLALRIQQHQPLNRQAERYAREGVPLSRIPPAWAACTLKI